MVCQKCKKHFEKVAKKADLVVSDPPYNVNYSGRGKSTKTKIMNDHMERSNFKAFLLAVFQGYQEAVTKTTPFYICHSSSSQIEFEQAMNEVGLKVKNQIIWNKKVASMGWGDYRWKHEPIFMLHSRERQYHFSGIENNTQSGTRSGTYKTTWKKL